jgi:hypothetical protein
MRGIIGFVGHRPACDVVIDVLRRMEYRDYDCAGVAPVNGRGSLTNQMGGGRVASSERPRMRCEVGGSQRPHRSRAWSSFASRRRSTCCHHSGQATKHPASDHRPMQRVVIGIEPSVVIAEHAQRGAPLGGRRHRAAARAGRLNPITCCAPCGSEKIAIQPKVRR